VQVRAIDFCDRAHFLSKTNRERIAIQKNLNSTHSGRSHPNLTTPLVILNLSDSSFNQTAGESLNTRVFVVVGSHVEEGAHVVHLVC